MLERVWGEEMAMKRRRKSAIAEMNVVPYIDVMLVLLVIFMITTPMLTQGVKINLPEATAEEIPSKDQIPMIVSVDAEGNYYLNITDKPDAPMAIGALLTRVAAELSIATEKGINRAVLVKGDSDVEYGKVVHAMVHLQRAGVKEVGLMTQQPNVDLSVKPG